MFLKGQGFIRAIRMLGSRGFSRRGMFFKTCCYTERVCQVPPRSRRVFVFAARVGDSETLSIPYPVGNRLKLLNPIKKKEPPKVANYPLHFATLKSR
jgi:hypothetical protein